MIKSTSSRFSGIAGEAGILFAILLFPLSGKETVAANPAITNISGLYAVQEQSLRSVPDIRLFIGKNIRYPKEAWDAGIMGIVDLFINVDNEGNVTGISKQRPSSRGKLIDGIIIVAVKPEGVDRVKYSSHPLLVAECQRVLQSMPVLDIPDLKGRSVRLSFSFILQVENQATSP
jgi:hypothetical protein